MSRYICHILLMIPILTLSACFRGDDFIPLTENPAIEFGLSDKLSVESKTAIDTANYQQFGFVALGGWSLGEWENDALFGADGTEVIYSIDNWDYSPKCYWQTGLYDFAGVMPSSLFASTYPYPGTTSSGTCKASLDADTHKTLTLSFGEGGYNLAEGQHDIMVAFDRGIYNSDRTMGTEVDGKLKQVSFAFEHQLSLVTIKAASLESRTDIRIDEIKVYGNHTSTAGDMSFTSDDDGTIAAGYQLTDEVTDKDNVYKTLLPSAENAWMLSNDGSYNVLVPDLLVFPESCDFTIVVTYTDCYNNGNITYTKTGTLTATWERGKKYNYSFEISMESISFAEPTVEPWGEWKAMDSDIEM